MEQMFFKIHLNLETKTRISGEVLSILFILKFQNIFFFNFQEFRKTKILHENILKLITQVA